MGCLVEMSLRIGLIGAPLPNDTQRKNTNQKGVFYTEDEALALGYICSNHANEIFHIPRDVLRRVPFYVVKLQKSNKMTSFTHMYSKESIEAAGLKHFGNVFVEDFAKVKTRFNEYVGYSKIRETNRKRAALDCYGDQIKIKTEATEQPTFPLVQEDPDPLYGLELLADIVAINPELHLSKRRNVVRAD